ncbi:MAG: hypothetical protein KKD99_13625, partial [Proteobacteria bacterium]|nr:hypothetical protein [Pseudomonadota bacterium]
MIDIKTTREWFAKKIAGGLMNREEVRDLVAQEIALAKMSLPITANYDPKNEGYRRMSGFDSRL